MTIPPMSHYESCGKCHSHPCACPPCPRDHAALTTWTCPCGNHNDGDVCVRCNLHKPEAPAEMTDERRGLYRKYEVRRLNDPTGRHAGCEYYVLDWKHDPFTIPAMVAYADACAAKFPLLAASLRYMVQYYGGQAAPPAQPETATPSGWNVADSGGYLLREIGDGSPTFWPHLEDATRIAQQIGGAVRPVYKPAQPEAAKVEACSSVSSQGLRCAQPAGHDGEHCAIPGTQINAPCHFHPTHIASRCPHGDSRAPCNCDPEPPAPATSEGATVRIVWIVNGVDVASDALPSDVVGDLMARRLAESGNTGRPPTDWEVRDEWGVYVDPPTTVAQLEPRLKIHNRLFVGLRAAAGGAATSVRVETPALDATQRWIPNFCPNGQRMDRNDLGGWLSLASVRAAYAADLASATKALREELRRTHASGDAYERKWYALSTAHARMQAERDGWEMRAKAKDVLRAGLSVVLHEEFGACRPEDSHPEEDAIRILREQKAENENVRGQFRELTKAHTELHLENERLKAELAKLSDALLPGTDGVTPPGETTVVDAAISLMRSQRDIAKPLVEEIDRLKADLATLRASHAETASGLDIQVMHRQRLSNVLELEFHEVRLDGEQPEDVAIRLLRASQPAGLPNVGEHVLLKDDDGREFNCRVEVPPRFTASDGTHEYECRLDQENVDWRRPPAPPKEEG